MTSKHTTGDMKKIIVKFDDKKIVLTQEYIEAVKQLMRAEILMMREQDKENSDCWYYGVAKIEDLCRADYLQCSYGGKEDVKWLKKEGQIFVEVPF